MMVGWVLKRLCNAVCSTASYYQHRRFCKHTLALSCFLYSSYPSPFSRHSLAIATANLSLISFILGRTSLASVNIRPRCHNVTGRVTVVRTHIVRPMIVAQAGSGDDSSRLASGSKKDDSVVVVIVSMTTGVEVLWCRRDGRRFKLNSDALFTVTFGRGLIGVLERLRIAWPACLDGPATQSRR